MTEDQIWRGVITAASVPVWAYLIQKTKAYLSAARDKSGRNLTERLGYRLGTLWAGRNHSAK